MVVLSKVTIDAWRYLASGVLLVLAVVLFFNEVGPMWLWVAVMFAAGAISPYRGRGGDGGGWGDGGGDGGE